MIENIRINIYPDSNGYTIVYFDINYNEQIYNWEVKIKSLDGKSVDQYLVDNLITFTNEIDEKELIWQILPHTTLDENNNIIELDKSSYVNPSTICKTSILNEMKTKTEKIIDEKMPQWRMNRWRRYYDLTQKYLSDSTSLNEIEKIEYDSFPDPGESHELCQQYVPLCLKWCVDCVNAHKLASVALYQATTMEDMIAAGNITYPPWPI